MQIAMEGAPAVLTTIPMDSSPMCRVPFPQIVLMSEVENGDSKAVGGAEAVGLVPHPTVVLPIG